MDWTTEAIDRLRAFWAEGHSTAEIGRRMGITKNSVVGKAHRLNLSARPSPIRRGDKGAARPAPGFRRHPAPAPSPAVAANPSRPQPVRSEQQRPELQRPEPQRHDLQRTDVMAASLPAQPVAPRPGMPGAPPAVASLPLMVVRPFPRMTRRDCCWPMGDPGTAGFRFCSGEANAGKPYCTEHAAVAYVKARDRREDAA